MAPDHVVEDVADVGRLVEGAEHGIDRRRPDLVATFDELDKLVDDGARLGDVPVVSLDRELVAAQPDRAAEAVAQRLEHAVADAGELGGDVVRDGERVLHACSVGGEKSALIRRRRGTDRGHVWRYPRRQGGGWPTTPPRGVGRWSTRVSRARAG
jgi:hypothetical protein